MTPAEARRAIDRATTIVAAWPPWKRGILESSSRPSTTPRPPVDNRGR